MITPDAAWEIVLACLKPLPSQVVRLQDALGYHLAETVRADRDLPPSDRSAMDGYAVRSADLRAAPSSLRLMGEVAAGSPSRPRLRPGCCVRIFTGACIPPGADAVAIQEQAEERDGQVTFRVPVEPGANILRRGEDARRGAVLLRPGDRLSAPAIGICAAVGKGKLRVHRRPRVKIICTGSELLPVEAKPRSWEIRNSVGPALAATLAEWGFGPAELATVPDEPARILQALRRAAGRFDVVLLAGGVSVGRYDFVPQAIIAAGGVIRFHGVGMKPGKPSLYATLGPGGHVFGLPGNPLSALTAFHEFAFPAIRRLAGEPQASCRPSLKLTLAEPAGPRTGRWRYQLGRLEISADGLRVTPLVSQSSADLASAGRASGAMALPPGKGVLEAGQSVVFRPWRPLP